MHELSLANAVIDTAVRHADGHRVRVVTLRVGRLRQVAPETLRFYFGFAARGTLCEAARLQLEVIPARLACADCGHQWELDVPVFRCPCCGSAGAEIRSGNEFQVESIEVEEAACIA